MKHSRVARWVLSLIAVLLLASIPLSGRSEEPFEINVIIPLTGGGTFLGRLYQQALNAVETHVNKTGGVRGRPIKFVIQDDQSNPQIAVQLAGNVLAKNPSVILAAALVAECNAISSLIKDGPLLYCLTPGVHPPKGSYVFSADPATFDVARGAIHYFRRRGITRFATITSTDATGQDADRAIAEALDAPENRGGTITIHEHFNPTDVSVSAQMARIKQADPQVLIAWATGAPFGTLLHGINDIGLSVPILTTNGNLTRVQMSQYAGFLPKDLYFPAVACVVPNSISDRAVKKAVDTYSDALVAVGAKPEYIPSVAYDPAMIVVDGFRKLGTGATAMQLRDYISNLNNWIGATGRYDFRAVPQRGLGLGDVLVVRWDQPKGDWVGVSKPGGDPL